MNNEQISMLDIINILSYLLQTENIKKDDEFFNYLSQLSKLPIVNTTVNENIYNDLCDKIENLLPLSLQAKPV